MGTEGDKKRIKDDIELFSKNVREIKITKENRKTVELAEKYCHDAAYFMRKKDYMSAFGCINYAHGLLDALRKAQKSPP
jgi:hypothetical protein